MRIGVVFLILLLGLVGSGGDCASRWNQQDFLISTWGEPGDDDSAQVFAEVGFEVVMSKSDKLDICAKHGLKSILTDASPDVVARVKDHPAVWGYFVRDEPWNAEEYKWCADKMAEIRKVDDTKPLYINLGGAFEEHTEFLDIVKPQYLSFDFYQWWWWKQYGRNHFPRLESYRKAALAHDLPLFCWVEANADPRYEWGEAGAGYLNDNAAKLRHSVYTNLAYGAKGIQWFTAGLAVSRNADGKVVKSMSGQDIAIINKELRALGPILLKLACTEVFHTSPVPPNCRLLPMTYWVTTDTPDVVIGIFRGADSLTYVMVVNRDWERPNCIDLWFDSSVSSVGAFDPNTKKWSSVLKSGAAGGGRVVIEKAPGDGVLLRLER